ncbi:pseudouridine-5'-phosphate glycosidase [Ahrensia marina]|uniref:pseudouridine-5'-phosphate glycosidase n=1 Tax=Ahrensia marina TaxID=1514904 RepID=UPI0035CF399F
MTSQPFSALIDIHPTVADALAEGRPLVALESTIITHGMPYPQNLEMAQAVEDIIAEGGATPALIAVVEGRIKVGLSDEERSALGQTKDARKASRADLAFAVSSGENAGTTVAATMMVAHMEGIKVFATGGIGGVHQGASESFDISADLIELGRTGVIVVAAGAKAILDIPKTLEVLETQGVPVVGYQTDVMPAFWSRTSDLPIPLRIDSAQEIAAFQKTRDQLGVDGGMLVANPIPTSDEISQDVMQGYIAQAQADLESQGITGKAVTPFLLARLLELTDGKSLTSNIALVKNNARLATEIAKALA